MVSDVPERPIIDGRRRDDVRAQLESIAPTHSDEWEPGSGDAGDAVFELFTAMAADVIERLDHSPEKHRVAFFDALGFSRRPPQSATAPVTFSVVESADENVAIRAGTELEAEVDGDELRFRVENGDGFEATPAVLEAVYAVDPAGDRFTDHGHLVDVDETAVLFGGTNRQEHALYVGHDERLDVSGEATFALELGMTPSNRLDDLVWEFYGESDTDGEGWNSINHEVLSDAVVAFELESDESFVETEFDGIESSWLRCLMPDDDRSDRFDIEIEAVTFRSPPDDPSNVVDVDGLYANDVPQPTDRTETIMPFGSHPRQRDAFYIGCEEAFTKHGATVTVAFENVDEEPTDADEIRLSWEYFDGDGWRRLATERRDDDDGAFPESISFVVPESSRETSVAGQHGVWIRARLVAGQFVDVRYEEDDDDELTRTVDGEAPVVDAVEITYRYDDAVDEPPTQLFAKNNGEFVERPRDETPFRPFEPLPDRTQTVYFGFDSPLESGPIQLYVDVDERVYPDGFDPQIRWEYCVDPDADVWARLSGHDDTLGFTESGLVSLSFPEATDAFSRFGHEHHWIRARVRGDEFRIASDGAGDSSGVSPNDSPEQRADGVDGHAKADGTDSHEACHTVLGAGASTTEPTRHPPAARGIYVNAGRVSNVTVVEDELLGSSDGAPNVSFDVANPPVVSLELWVDESGALSADERSRLRSDHPDDVDVERDRNDEITAFWIRWEAVDDLQVRAGDERVYVVDRVAGTVTFGDGASGRIPPSGRDNVRVTYRTGGGAAGNVPSEGVDSLTSSIPLIEDVTNPVVGAGGASAESTAAVLERAPKTLRDRGRAVTAVDFERIAMDATRRLAAVTCIPGMTRAGAYEPGWVTVVIVPDVSRTTPTPSPELRRRVTRAVSERAPLTLVANDRLVVRGPTYVSVAVDATIVAEEGERLNGVEDRVDERLSTFLHPLSGADGDGWAFGELPSVSDFYARIERCRGIDHVESLAVRYVGPQVDVTITEGEPPPDGAPDVLVRSGAHDIAISAYEHPCKEDD